LPPEADDNGTTIAYNPEMSQTTPNWPAIDLRQLSIRESEQIEWKENVADVNDVVATLCAFANDLANLGGGYVICGAREEKDEHGFPQLMKTGLTANRLKEIEGRTLSLCRDRVSPPITPRVEEVTSDNEDRRILVFIQPATGQDHTFRRADHGARHFVRVGRSTIEARNGVLRDLLVRKGALEPWDRRVSASATVDDLDLLSLRDALQRAGVFSAERGVEPYLSPDTPINPFVPALCVREPLTGMTRPRNFAVLLFGRDVQRFIPGAVSLFSIYPGTDRSDIHAERHEIAGNLIEQARRLTELLDIQSYAVFDKSDSVSPNTLKYPRRALYEALGNALAHRDYELSDPTRITVFSDRIEVLSPGPLPLGVDPEAFRTGRAEPRWRNQALAWFFSRLQFAQAEGQGIPTIIRVMREEGSPDPTLDPGDARVLCILPAHPRHAVLQDLRSVEQAIALGDLTQARELVQRILSRDPMNYRAVQLLAEVQHGLRDPQPVYDWIVGHEAQVETLPPPVLLQLSEALMTGDRAPEAFRRWSQRLLFAASRGRLEERELRRIAVGMLRARDDQGALALLTQQLQEHPEWQHSASLLQLRGDALTGLARRCQNTAKNWKLPSATKRRAWQEFYSYLDKAETDLGQARALSLEPELSRVIDRNIDFARKLRRENPPQHPGRR
jgi:ATP-dependent DNA helicase RecG